MFKKLFIIFLLLIIPVFNVVLAQGEDVGEKKSGDPVTLTDPLGGTTANPITPQILIGRVISSMMGIVGSLALAMFIYGGFLWMTAAGNSESVSKGKDVLIWATLGLIVIFTSYALVKFVFTSLGVV